MSDTKEKTIANEQSHPCKFRDFIDACSKNRYNDALRNLQELVEGESETYASTALNLLSTRPEINDIIRELATTGNAIAQTSMGFSYGIYNDQSLFWFMCAAKKGYVWAVFSVGEYYYVRKKFKQAVKWYEQGAANNHAQSQTNLGICYLYGKGVKKNYERASMLFAFACEQGCVYGEAALAICYYMGYGVTKDLNMCLLHARSASKNGHAGSNIALKKWSTGDFVDTPFE